MYCTECGQRAAGKFCRHCGTAISTLSGDAPGNAYSAFDWEQSFDYEAILQVPEVRSRRAQAAAKAAQGVSSKKLLQLLDQAATPLTGGMSSIALSKIAQPLTAKLGFKTGKERRESIALPPGRVLANIAVALAHAGGEQVRAEPSSEGCQLTAILPADLRSMEGKLSLAFARQGDFTLLFAQMLIEGVWYDWGKCNRQLDSLFAAAKMAA